LGSSKGAGPVPFELPAMPCGMAGKG